MSKPSIYLCGPITGMSYGEARFGQRKAFADLIDERIDIFSPMRQEGHLAEIQKISDKPYDSNVMSSSRGIVAKDKLDVQRATLIVANFLGAKIISVGSLIELGWANAWDKPVMIIMEKEGNPHDRFFLTEMADFRTDSVSEAAHMANALLLPGL